LRFARSRQKRRNPLKSGLSWIFVGTFGEAEMLAGLRTTETRFARAIRETASAQSTFLPM
jgi:hypothetical protein